MDHGKSTPPPIPMPCSLEKAVAPCFLSDDVKSPHMQCHGFIFPSYLVLLCTSYQKEAVLPGTSNIKLWKALCEADRFKEKQEDFTNKYPGTKPPVELCIQSYFDAFFEPISVSNVNKPRSPSVQIPK